MVHVSNIDVNNGIDVQIVHRTLQNIAQTTRTVNPKSRRGLIEQSFEPVSTAMDQSEQLKE